MFIKKNDQPKFNIEDLVCLKKDDSLCNIKASFTLRVVENDIVTSEKIRMYVLDAVDFDCRDSKGIELDYCYPEK